MNNSIMPDILLTMKQNLLKSITPYKAPEVVQAVLQTCILIDKYIDKPSDELYTQIINMFTILDDVL